MTSIVQTIDTPDGPFTILTDEHARVLASGWTANAEELRLRIRPSSRPASVTGGRIGAAAAVLRYYTGDLSALDVVALAPHGTALQLAGWSELRRIPAGAPVSYRRFAELLGRPRAVRAAASICARNAIALFIPCHRVLRNDGGLGGFAWGLPVKASLLQRESVPSLTR